MKNDQINRLLEKFYAGETSLEEEKLLQWELARRDLPEEMKPHQDIFSYLAAGSKEKIEDEEFFDRIEKKMEDGSGSLRRQKSRFLYPLAAAAAVLIAVGIFILARPDGSSLDKYDIDEPDKAFSEAKKALMLVSVNLNYGIKELDKISALDKGLNELEILSKIDEYQQRSQNKQEN